MQEDNDWQPDYMLLKGLIAPSEVIRKKMAHAATELMLLKKLLKLAIAHENESRRIYRANYPKEG
jgi:hypothetical protein